MVMQYFEGGSMSQYLKNNYNKLNLNSIIKRIFYIAKGLKAIHSKGFIHKDLHSGNILSWGDSYVYITDLMSKIKKRKFLEYYPILHQKF